MARIEGLKEGKVGVTGGVTQRSQRRATPRLHIFGASFNSAKAHLALRISSAWKGTEIRMMDIGGENCKPDFVRLNPNMTVPAVEIDDKIITDSDILTKYLFEHYPGRGDQQVVSMGKAAELWRLVDLVLKWDEGLYTYGHMSGEKGGGMGMMMNLLRRVRLRQNYLRLRDTSEKVWDGRTLAQAYEQKIAYISALSSKVDVAMTPEKKAAMDANERNMEELFATACGLLDASGGSGFLYGDELTTADAYFAPLLFRVEQMDKKELEAIFVKFPQLRGYWGRFCKTEHGQQAITKFTMKWAMRFALMRCLPCSMAGIKMGCVKAPALPADAEARIKSMSA